MKIGEIDLQVDKVSFSGGAPRFSFKTTLSSEVYAVVSGSEPRKISASFLLKPDERSTINSLDALYRKGAYVSVAVDDQALEGVITELSWDDDGSVIRGRISIVECDGVIGVGDSG